LIASGVPPLSPPLLVFFTNNTCVPGLYTEPAAQATVPGKLHTANGEVLPEP
jgi:hypothetical protein